jgi:formylglycine-generating enzyme required for sulfatase activity
MFFLEKLDLSKRRKAAVSAVFFTAITLAGGCSSKPPQDMIEIQKGEFTMGSNQVDKEAKAMQYGSRKPWFANERPERKVTLSAFLIDKTEVTNRQYKEFVDIAGHKPPINWNGTVFPQALAEHPVTHVSWFDADEFCRWKKKRLPTEAEWEKAARGTDGRQFPWGNEFDNKKVNTMGEFGGTTPVGFLPDGKSPYGVLDMAGNVQEWTADWYKPYPNSDYNDADYGEKFKVVRGGGWGGMGHYTLQVYVRTSFRNMAQPEGGYNDVGFRCVWPVK